MIHTPVSVVRMPLVWVTRRTPVADDAPRPGAHLCIIFMA